MSKKMENPEDRAAFDRCIDVLTKLILKYGRKVLAGLQTLRVRFEPLKDKWRHLKKAEERYRRYLEVVTPQEEKTGTE